MIGSQGGVPTLMVNGKPYGPMFYTGDYRGNIDQAQVWYLYQGGMRVFFVFANAETNDSPDDPAYSPPYRWVLADDWRGYEKLDQRIHSLLQVAPDAKVIIRVWFPVRLDFGLQHPGDVIWFEDGHNGPWTDPSTAFIKDPSWPRYSIYSSVWQSEAENGLRALIAHVRAADYSDHVVGYMLTAGAYGEWYPFGDTGGQATDFSPAAVDAFRTWLQQKYGTDEALRQAWNDPSVTLGGDTIPTRQQRDVYDYFGSFLELPRRQYIFDYYSFCSDWKARVIGSLARVVKEETDGKALVGAFYGDLQNVQYLESGFSLFRRLLNDPAIDFWSAPPTYENRGPGGTPTIRFPLETLKLHGKLWIDETDARTVGAGPAEVRFGAPASLQESVEELRKFYSLILTRGVTGYWFEQSPGWYASPTIREAMAQMQQIGQIGVQLPRQSATDVAVIVDQESLLVTKNKITTELVDKLKVDELFRMGTPPDFYEMDDLRQAAKRGYRMYIFLNAFLLNQEERRVIDSLKRDGNVLVFFFAPGLGDPDTRPVWSTSNSERLTGMHLAYRSGWHTLQMNPTAAYVSTLGEMPAGIPIGRFYRPITTGFTATPEKPQSPPPSYASGYFYVDDPQSTALATYVGTADAGFAIRRFPDWTSVYFGGTALPAVTLRQLAHLAGAHLYVEDDDVIYGNQSFLALYVTKTGVKTVYLAKPADVYDMFDDHLIGAGIDHFQFDAEANSTHLFFIGKMSDLESASKSQEGSSASAALEE